MDNKVLVVSLENKKVKVPCNNISSLNHGVKSKLRIFSDAFRLEYLDDDVNDWITLGNDEDLEDVSTSTKIRVILEETSSQPEQGNVNNEAPKSDSEAFNTTPSHSNHTGGGVNIKIKGGLLTAKNIHLGKGDNVAGTAKDIENFKKPENEKADSATVNIDVEIGDDAKFESENIHAGIGDNYAILKDVDPADFYFPGYDGEKFDVKSLLKKALTEKSNREKQTKNQKRKDKSESYPLNNRGQSQALIFNFMFSNTRHDREGANHDTTYLKQLLSFHGFQIQSVDNDQTEENMNKIIKQFLNSKEIALAPMVLLFIGSHGKQVNGTDYFWDANMNSVSVTSIVDMFATNKDFTALQGKPKLFWFQFCREKTEEKVKSDSMEESFLDWYKSQIPSSDGIEDDLNEKVSDMFLAYATLPNLKAYRDKGDGSWFVKSICKVFIENSFKDEYKKMFEEVNKAVKEKNFKKYIQMCDLKNGLKKSLYFYPQ